MTDKTPSVNSRLSRLETIIESISDAVGKIETKLDTSTKVNWAPIAIGVTVFFTVAGSVSTIYNARISTINSAVEAIAGRTMELEKAAVGNQLKIDVGSEKTQRLEKDVEELNDRVTAIEKTG